MLSRHESYCSYSIIGDARCPMPCNEMFWAKLSLIEVIYQLQAKVSRTYLEKSSRKDTNVRCVFAIKIRTLDLFNNSVSY